MDLMPIKRAVNTLNALIFRLEIIIRTLKSGLNSKELPNYQVTEANRLF